VIDAPEVRADNWSELLPTADAARVLGIGADVLSKLETKYKGTDKEIPVVRMKLDAAQAEILGTRAGKAILYPLPESLRDWYGDLQSKEDSEVEVVGKAVVAPSKFEDLELTRDQEKNLGNLTFRLRCEIEEVFPKVLDADPAEIAEVALAAGGDYIKLHLPPVVLAQIRSTSTAQGVTPAEWIIGVLKMTRGAGLVFLE
jgi:hypothetical protein